MFMALFVPVGFFFLFSDYLGAGDKPEVSRDGKCCFREAPQTWLRASPFPFPAFVTSNIYQVSDLELSK